MFCSPLSGATTRLCTCFGKHRSSNFLVNFLTACQQQPCCYIHECVLLLYKNTEGCNQHFSFLLATQSQASGHLQSERGGMLGSDISCKDCRRAGQVTAMEKEGLSGLQPPPQRGSGRQPQCKQVTWAKAESRKHREVWRLELPVPSSPLRMSCYPLPCLTEGNSSGIQITATNAESAGWKPLCERVKSLIHLKIWQVL